MAPCGRITSLVHERQRMPFGYRGIPRRPSIMIETSGSENRSPRGCSDDRLDSWKQIAVYLKREVRTVQLWEKNERLPVRRHWHTKLGTVYAYRSEIDKWQQGRSGPGTQGCLSNFSCEHDPIEFCSSLIRKPVIVVRPFATQAPHPEDDKFSDRLRNEVTSCLSRSGTGSAAVIASGAYSQIRTGPLTLTPGLNRGLDGDYVVAGTIQRSGLDISVTVQLIDLHDETVLWRKRYQYESGNSSAVQRAIAEQIAHSMFRKALPAGEDITTKSPARTQEAYDAYVKGRYFLRQRTVESVNKAKHHFDRAIQEDSTFASAYSGLADCYKAMSFHGMFSSAQLMPKAKTAAMTALEFDSQLGEAHASLADIHMEFEFNWEKAGKEFELSIGLNPRYAAAYQWYASYYALMGRYEESQILIARAHMLDPTCPALSWCKGLISFYARNYDMAIRHYTEALELDPAFAWAHGYLGLAYSQLGKFDEAVMQLRKGISLTTKGDAYITAMLGYVYARMGKKAAAQRILNKLELNSEQRCLPTYEIATISAALGDKTAAVNWLYRTHRERSPRIVAIEREPRFDDIRGIPRFRELVRRIGLA
jgi:tetratricopeptide (TPR) repeat protein